MNYSNFKNNFHIKLNEQQEAAVQRVQGPVLLLAVPGSGKTTVLVARLGYMLYCHGIHPNEILTMTYTKAATQDMRERFGSKFGDQFRDTLEFRTINGISNHIIKYYEKIKNETAFQLMQNEATLSCIIGKIYRKITSDYATESDIKAIRTQIAYIKNMYMTDPEIAGLKIDNGQRIAPIYQEYRSVLHQRRWMDYDDQMVYAYKILHNYPDIRKHFQHKYRYFCVDEAQDTSKIQHMLIQQLVGAERNLFMVGDEDQSIYGFRAAYPQALMEFERVYPRAVVLKMEENYRSTGRIVRQADRFIQQNKARYSKHMTTDNEDGSPIQIVPVENREEQYRTIARLADQCDRETAVLYRDNDSAIPIIDLLNRQGTDYRCRQMESSFFNHRVVRDITDIIRFAYDPTNAECFLRIYYKLSTNISKEQAVAAQKQASISHTSVLDELLKSELPDWCRGQIKALRTGFLNLTGETTSAALRRIVHSMGYGDYLSQHHIDSGKIAILEILAVQEKTPMQFLSRLKELQRIVEAGTPDSKSQFILSTIHSSKGLEYEHVILADVLDGILPKKPSEEQSLQERESLLEEERRLFYVAMTRAKRELLLYRFSEEGLSSSFVNNLFPPQTKAISTSALIQPNYQSISKKDFSKISEKYIPQTKVHHRMFGSGIIMEKDQNIVTIRFQNGSTKYFDLITALQSGALSLQ